MCRWCSCRPAECRSALERAARDNRQALSLLGATYSANAYPFSLQYQNCNQWVAEMLAAAWGALAAATTARARRPSAGCETRATRPA